jgi:hypothetical protein
MRRATHAGCIAKETLIKLNPVIARNSGDEAIPGIPEIATSPRSSR